MNSSRETPSYPIVAKKLGCGLLMIWVMKAGLKGVNETGSPEKSAGFGSEHPHEG